MGLFDNMMCRLTTLRRSIDTADLLDIGGLNIGQQDTLRFPNNVATSAYMQGIRLILIYRSDPEITTGSPHGFPTVTEPFAEENMPLCRISIVVTSHLSIGCIVTSNTHGGYNNLQTT